MINSRICLNNQPAIVLHYYNYRDSSLIVNLFLSDEGKINVIAKGVKQKKNRQLTALLQPFNKLTVSLSGKQDLLNLRTVEATEGGWKLAGKSLYCAYYINELLLRLLPSHCDCQEIFSLYDQILKMLESASLMTQSGSLESADYEIPLRIFELKLLELLGYGLNLGFTIDNGHAISAQQSYYYSIDSGAKRIKPEQENYCKLSGQTLLNLEKLHFPDKRTLVESKQLLKCVLAEHLGNKPLKSRQLYKELYCL